MKTILLCSDLDRTLIPNGNQEESPEARKCLSQLFSHPELQLAYVTGRHDVLVKEAITEYQLPVPDFVIGDVGTTLYRIDSGQWLLDKNWQQEIGQDWHDKNRERLVELLAQFADYGFQLQEREKQNNYKISYYTDPDLSVNV
ncbi:MAG: HAD family hydrolase, partial [Desulforhopalus sp.]